MEQLIKNLDRAQPLPLKEQVAYEKGKVVSLTLTQRPGVGMTLFAFDAGEGISTHAAPGDAMVYVLDGEAQITIGGAAHTVPAGSAIIMPAGIPHAVPGAYPIQNAAHGCQSELNRADQHGDGCARRYLEHSSFRLKRPGADRKGEGAGLRRRFTRPGPSSKGLPPSHGSDR